MRPRRTRQSQVALRASGYATTEAAVEDWAVSHGFVNASVGLTGASGAGLVKLAQHFGADAKNYPNITWDWLVSNAGKSGLCIGGAAWGAGGHWVGVRWVSSDQKSVRLANPALGYAGISDTLDQASFQRLGPFSAVVIQAKT